MATSSGSLSIDEFAALVAAALGDIDIYGSNSHKINCADGQERLLNPPTTSTPLYRRPFSSWRRKRPKSESTSSSRFCSSATDFVDSPDTEFATASLGNYLTTSPFTPGMTTLTSEPTVLAASMSTVDLGNCLGVVGGGCGSCSCVGTSSGSRNSASMGCNVSSVTPTNVNTTSTVPTFTLEMEGDTGLLGSSDGPIDLVPNVIDLSSTLRLPRTPSPLFRKSAPDLRIQDPPQSQCRQPESPRSPRKSFFSKLKKQLSSKTPSGSHSNQSFSTMSTPVPTVSIPDCSNAHSDGSPRGLFKLHLSLPLTPLSLSTSTSPNPSRSPSPRFPFRAVSASYKRESAPPTMVVGKPPSTGSNPILVSSDRPALPAGDDGKRRIHSVHDYDYGPTYSDQDSPSSRAVEKGLQEQTLQCDEEHARNNSILSLADCLVGGSRRPQMNWMKGQSKRHRGKKSSSTSNEGGAKDSGRSSQPFPSLTHPDSDDALSDPSKYSCESAPRSAEMSSRAKDLKHETNSAMVNANEVLPGWSESERESTLLPQGLPVSPSHSILELEEEPLSYAPFVPLVFQHERLQQKLKRSVPLASFDGMPAGDECIKAVPLKPFPPRTTSLSSASLHVRQRTKSAPNALHSLTPSGSKQNSAIPPIPILPTHLASVPNATRNLPAPASQTLEALSKKGRKVERPTTAPANSASFFKAQGVGAIPFPVVKDSDAREDNFDSERQRKPSKLKRLKLRKNAPSLLQSPVSTQPPAIPSPLENSHEHSNLSKEVDSGSRTESVGLSYSLSLSKHPYAQARSSEGVSCSPEESDAKATPQRPSKTFVTFVPSTTEGESSRLRSQTDQGRFKATQTLIPSSPTSPTSNSGSGSSSEASTKSPVTPRSPLVWTTGGTAGTAAAVKSRIGLGIAGFPPMSGSEEGKTEYKPPHPYSRSYSTMNLSAEDEDTTTDGTPPRDHQNIIKSQFPHSRSIVDDNPSTALPVNRRPSMQTVTYHGAVPSKPPPIGPLPCPPSAQEKGGSDGYKSGDKFGEVPPSPVPSEYVKPFSNPSTRIMDDDNDSVSNPRAAPSYAPSQSSESYEHDPEYEALLAANTRANVGELASMRNIGVGRRLMSGYPQPPSSRIDTTPSKVEGKRKRVHSEATRHPGMSGEWTLFLGNDTPPRREDIIADLSSVPMTGIKTLSSARARTKSESALTALELGKQKPCGMKRVRSSTLAPGPSAHVPPPPVPKLLKRKQEDWTLSLPLLPPDEGDQINLTTVEAELSGTGRISDPLAGTLIRGAKSPQYPEPQVVVCVEGVVVDDEFNLDDADDITVAESRFADSAFGLDIDSLDLDDEDDSILDFPANSAPARMPGVLPFDRLLFSVPRVVSKGSGMECAKWGEDEDGDEEIIKKRGRRLSDGLDSLLGMAGVSVRVDVNEDGESICVVDGLSLNTEGVEDGSEEGSMIEGHESLDLGPSDAMKENLARLDALSADLKRFNELLKTGVSATTAVDLKHAKSCGLFPSQKEEKTEHLRVQQSLDALRDISAGSPSTKPGLGTSVKDRAKVWAERSGSLSGPPNVPVSSSPRPSSPPSSLMAVRGRPPLPFAPSFPPNARPLSRGAALGIGPRTMSPPGRSATARAMTITTKPPCLKLAPAIGATIPDDVVGSGLKVGGNGRVISLSCSAAAAPVVANTQAGSLRVITNESKEKKPAAIVIQDKDDEMSEGNGHDAILVKYSKRDSVSSFVSTDSFFTSFSSPSQAPTPPPNMDMATSRPRQGSGSSEGSSSSDSPTPTATSPPGLLIITSSTTNSTRAHSPVADVYTPSSSAMPTPLASSFPAVPPLPPALSTLGDDLKTVSRMLSATWMSQNQTRGADESLEPNNHSTDWDALRLSCMSAQTIVSEHEPSQGLPPDTPASEAERDTESIYSDSFYSARSSFEA